MKNNENIENFFKYIEFKQLEKFVESLVFSRPTPHFVASKHKINKKKPFGLERVESFLKQLNNPHLKNKFVHIAGTSGKTSTSYFVTSALCSQGFNTGMYISPHITSMTERFMINLQIPPVKDIINIINEYKHIIEIEYENKEMGVISYFEFLLSIALKYFEEKKVDFVTLEVGLGGRYDATNVIKNSEISILTNIGLDHTHILGNTVEKIASDKIGIIRYGTPLLTAEKEENILNIFKIEAKKFNTDIHILGKEFKIENMKIYKDGTSFDYLSNYNKFNEIKINMCGEYQAENSSLAIRTVEILSEKNNTKINEETLRKNLSSTKIPARFEIINKNPIVILDGAHNTDKIENLVKYIKQIFKIKNIIFICGFTSGRNPEEMLKSMMEVSNDFILTRVFSGYREDEEPLYLKYILKKYNSNTGATIKLDPFDALDLAIYKAKKDNKIVCVTGSLYLVSYLREKWFSEFHSLNYK